MTVPGEFGPGVYRSQNMDPDGPGIDTAALNLPSEVNAPLETPDLQAHRDEVVAWSREAGSIRHDIMQRRIYLEKRLAYAIMEGYVLLDAARREKRDIDANVGRGVLRSYTYYASDDHARDRVQLYYATVDQEGNIWGEFMHKSRETASPGYPVPAGKQLIRRNPTL